MQFTEWPPFLLSRNPAVPVLAAPAPADLAPARASYAEPRSIMSLLLQRITSAGHSGRANAVFTVASNQKTFHFRPQPKAYPDSPICSVILASGVYLLQRMTCATSPMFEEFVLRQELLQSFLMNSVDYTR